MGFPNLKYDQSGQITTGVYHLDPEVNGYMAKDSIYSFVPGMFVAVYTLHRELRQTGSRLYQVRYKGQGVNL